MRDDSEVIRSTAFRLFTRLPLVVCLTLACEREGAPATSTEATPTGSAPSAVPTSAASELFIDSDDGTLESAGAMDELIALACADGPVPDDLEVAFYDGSTDLGIGTPEPERGLYAGNRVVHYPRITWTFDRMLLDGDLARRVCDPAFPARSSVNAELRLRVLGRLPESIRRELWCLTARDLAQLGVPSGGTRCVAPPDAMGVPAIRISTRGRVWRRRTRLLAPCSFDSFIAAHTRFDRTVTGDRFSDRRTNHLPIDLVELRARATDECSVGSRDFSMALELDDQGDLREVRADGAQLPEVAAACIASIARRGDYSSLTGDQIVTGFELEKTVIELRWVDGYPYSREPVPDG